VVNPIRAAGRWVKRARLRLLRDFGRDKHRWNTELSWREFFQGRLRLTAYPRLVQLGSTMACNLRCFFCMRTVELIRSRHAQLKDPLNREIPRAVLEQALGLMPYAETFDLTPFGENFLYSQFDRILETHQRLGCRNLTMTTAGTLITPARAEHIVRAEVQHVKISIEESMPAHYAAMRVGARLEQVVNGIGLINEWKRKLDSTVPRLTFAASYMLRNIERLPEMVRFAAIHHVPEIYVQMFELRYNDDPAVRKEELTYHIPLLRQMIAEGEAEARKLGIGFVVTMPILNLLRSEAGDGRRDAGDTLRTCPAKHRPLTQQCTNPWWWAYIDESGNLWPCCWAKVSFGNLQKKSFLEVWNSHTAQEMRRRFLADDIPNYCRGQLCHVDFE
jgi:MoaA/NifB/PqqE/SkfB family radical SAM enzyme